MVESPSPRRRRRTSHQARMLIGCSVAKGVLGGVIVGNETLLRQDVRTPVLIVACLLLGLPVGRIIDAIGAHGGRSGGPSDSV